jgi:hypothetical protein
VCSGGILGLGEVRRPPRQSVLPAVIRCCFLLVWWDVPRLTAFLPPSLSSSSPSGAPRQSEPALPAGHHGAPPRVRAYQCTRGSRRSAAPQCVLIFLGAVLLLEQPHLSLSYDVL